MWHARWLHSLAGQLMALVVASLFIGASAAAQTVNGAFHGTVTDTSGAVMPGVTVKISNQATNVAREVATNMTGFYVMTQIPPGVYTFDVSKSGFTTVRQTHVQLLVNQDLEVNFTLQVGQVSQQVQVTAAPPALETANATIGQVVGSRQIVDLPLNGRQFTQLILLTPGAAPKENGQQGAFTISIGGGGISPSVNGQRGQENNYTLDGALNNYLFENTWAISPPPDAIQEFKVQSHITDAQFSISSGANVNVATKSGGNQFHGDVWEFLRNDSLDAANFFDNYFREAKPPYRQNQFGFTAGGPVTLPHYDGRQKKTYFFGYYEGFRSQQGFTLLNNVPTSQELGGNFSDLLTGKQATTPGPSGQPVPLFDALGRPIMSGQIYNPYSTRQVTAGQVDPVTGLTAQSSGLVRDPFVGNIVPGNMLNAQMLAYLHAFYPGANFGPGGNSFPNWTGSSNQVITSDQFGVKIDHSFHNNDTLYGGFYYSQPLQTSPSALLLGAGELSNKARQIALGYTHLFSPTFLGTFRYGYTYTNFFSNNAGATPALLQATNQLNILPERNGVPLLPEITLSPRLGATNQFAIPLGPIRSHLFSGDLQKIRGSHTFSAGFMFYHIHSFDDGWGMLYGFDQFPSSAIAASGANVGSTGDGLASALLNLPSSLFGFLGATQADMTDLWQGYYLQDKWQVSKKLNLQFGLRYDYVPPMHWKNNKVSGFSLTCGCFLLPVAFPPSFPFPNVRDTYYDPQYNGWQPRFGFAYSATPKMVIRGAFAVFDDHNNNLIQATQAVRIGWPWAAGVSFGALNRGIPGQNTPSVVSTLTFSPSPSAASFLPVAGQPSTPQFDFSSDPVLRIPYAMEWNFGIERSVTPNLTASVDYVGSGDRHLYVTPIANTPLPSKMGPNAIPGGAPYPQFGQFNYTEDNGTSNYDALQVKVERRFSEGLTFLGAYTWSHCLDISSGGTDSAPQTIYDMGRDYANCDFDITHMFVFSSAYQLPIGRGRHFGSNWGGVTDALLGGWTLSGIWSLQSGSPFSVSLPFDVANVNGGFQRAQLVGNPLPPGFKQTINAWYNPAAFALPAPYTFGNLGRNTLRGPSQDVLDVALAKDFQLRESLRLQFRGEFFNLPNLANFSPPGLGASAGFSALAGSANTAVDTPTFMKIFGAGPARQVQFGLKLLW
jgi:hypothetical protein